VGEASRLDQDRGKMPLPHGHPNRNRKAILTIVLSACAMIVMPAEAGIQDLLGRRRKHAAVCNPKTLLLNRL
jgi:hypothetical protein